MCTKRIKDDLENLASYIERQFLRGLLRIAILVILDRSSHYGYQIYKILREKLYSRLSLSTLYTLLKELENKGLIRRIDDKYILTEKGSKIIKLLFTRYNKLLNDIRIRIEI